MPATLQSSQRSDHREWWASTWFHSMNKSVWVLLKLLLQQLSQQSVIFLGGHPQMEINMQHQRWPLTGHGPGEVDDFQIAGPNRNGLIHIWYYMIPYIYMYIYNANKKNAQVKIQQNFSKFQLSALSAPLVIWIEWDLESLKVLWPVQRGSDRLGLRNLNFEFQGTSGDTGTVML